MSYYLYWNDDKEYTIIEALNDQFAMSLVFLKGRPLHRETFREEPDGLQVLATVHEVSLDNIISAYVETDPELKPVQRARRAFKEAFGRSCVQAENHVLPDIVRRAKTEEVLHGEPTAVSSDNITEDLGGTGDPGEGAGGPAGPDEVGAIQETEREPIVDTSGDVSDS